MKNIKTKILVLLFITLSRISNSQQIYFNDTKGSQSIYEIADVRKLTFTDEILYLYLKDGSIFSWDFNTLNYYNYNNNFTVNTQDWINNANTWDLLIYPNPTSNNLHINFNLQTANVITLNLYDLHGKLILQKILGEKTIGKHQEIINISDLANGVYTCVLSGINNKITKQIIKN